MEALHGVGHPICDAICPDAIKAAGLVKRPSMISAPATARSGCETRLASANLLPFSRSVEHPRHQLDR
jgi:hypothetical protein